MESFVSLVVENLGIGVGVLRSENFLRVRAGCGAALVASLVVVVSVALATATVAAESSPRLIVSEETGLSRAGHPVTSGMPLPPGWLGPRESAHLGTSAGAVPTQQRVLSSWPDGSVRWLLLDFQAALAPRQRLELTLRKGASPPPPVKVSVEQRGADVEIDTGAIRLLAGKGSGGYFRLLAIDGRKVEGEAVGGELDVGGAIVAAPLPEEIVVEERGPLRAAVTLRGRWPNGFSYDVRLEAYAGRSTVRVLHTFVNGAPAGYTNLRQLSVQVPSTVGATARFSAALDAGTPSTGDIGAKGVEFEQVDAHLFRRGEETRRGRLSGWFEVRGPSTALGLDVPFLWQEFPQAVRLSASGLKYDLWSARQAPARVGVGAAKTHEFTLTFSGGPERPLAPDRGVTAAPDPTWTAACGALLNAVDPRREADFVGEVARAFDRFRRSVGEEPWDEGEACEPGGTEIRRVGFYGMLNWGDWNFRGYHDTTKACDAWGNQEYDLAQVLGLLFAATGRADVRPWLTAAARHFAEVDRIHVQSVHPDWVGMNHPKNPRHFSFEYGGVDLGHTWVEGMFTYYFLTGEPRILAAGVGISDYLVGRLRTAVRGNPRQFGWPALALAAAYEATGEARYKQAALDYARAGVAAHGVEKVGRDWKIAILADAVSYVHALTGDEALLAWLRRYAAAVVARPAKTKDVRYYPGVAYVARVGGDAGLRATARDAAARIRFGAWGKPFTIGSRIGFRIVSQLDSPPTIPTNRAPAPQKQRNQSRDRRER